MLFRRVSALWKTTKENLKIKKMSPYIRVLLIISHMRHKIDVRGYPIAKYLQERGHDVTLMVTSDQRRLGIVEDDWDGVRTVEFPDLLFGKLRQGWDPWNAINKINYLNTNKRSYDLIHCLETRPATIHPALMYKKRNNLPMITDWIDWWGRGGIIDELRPSWYRTLFGSVETYYEEAFRTRAEGLTVISTALADRAVRLGVDPTRILHLPNGSWNTLFNVPDIEACRQKVGLDTTGPIIGFSSLDSHLDLSIIFESLRQIVQRYPGARLLITGKPSAKILKLAQACGVGDNLILTGFLTYEKLPWYLGCADLFVLPFSDKVYNIGRWPSKINGYMSVGRPTVSNPVGDINTLFKNHNIGLLAEWDPSDFSQKIIFLLENPEVAMEMGKNARKVSETEYDWAVLIAELEAFYYDILQVHREQGAC